MCGTCFHKVEPSSRSVEPSSRSVCFHFFMLSRKQSKNVSIAKYGNTQEAKPSHTLTLSEMDSSSFIFEHVLSL